MLFRPDVLTAITLRLLQIESPRNTHSIALQIIWLINWMLWGRHFRIQANKTSKNLKFEKCIPDSQHVYTFSVI